MLDAYVIEAIRQEQLEREREFERRRVWLELPLPTLPSARDEQGSVTEERGPIVIPFGTGISDPEEDAA